MNFGPQTEEAAATPSWTPPKSRGSTSLTRPMCLAALRTVAGLAVLSAAAVVLVYLAVATLIFKRPVAQTVIGALA